MQKGFLIGTLVCLAVFALPLGIAMTVVGAMQRNTCHNDGVNVTAGSGCTCDITDPMGLNVADYLLGLGIASIILTCSSILSSGISLCANSVIPMIFAIVIGVLCVLFSTPWFIVGAIIQFRSNIICIQLGEPHVIFALVMWCFTAFQIVQNICNSVFHFKK